MKNDTLWPIGVAILLFTVFMIALALATWKHPQKHFAYSVRNWALIQQAMPSGCDPLQHRIAQATNDQQADVYLWLNQSEQRCVRDALREIDRTWGTS